METTKIQLSTDELRLMQNSDVILTKNLIIEKVNMGLGKMALQMQLELTNRKLIIPTGDLFNPKIAKGEKYRGLPYLMLDYPRLFDKENILAIRTFFWWGNFCSITLHVRGIFLLPVKEKFLSAIGKLSGRHYYISLSGDEWDHNINGEAYQTLKGFDATNEEENLRKAVFLKLAAKVNFSQWHDMEADLSDYFLDLVKLIEA